MFHSSAKVIWDVVRDTYSLENNASRIFEVYEEVFSLLQGGKIVTEYYSQIRSMIDEMYQYHPLTVDLETAMRQREELYVCKFLSGLRTIL